MYRYVIQREAHLYNLPFKMEKCDIGKLKNKAWYLSTTTPHICIFYLFYQKNNKSHSGHGLRMKITGDMFGLRLLNKKHLYLTICHFSFKILM